MDVYIMERLTVIWRANDSVVHPSMSLMLNR